MTHDRGNVTITIDMGLMDLLSSLFYSDYIDLNLASLL